MCARNLNTLKPSAAHSNLCMKKRATCWRRIPTCSAVCARRRCAHNALRLLPQPQPASLVKALQAHGGRGWYYIMCGSGDSLLCEAPLSHGAKKHSLDQAEVGPAVASTRMLQAHWLLDTSGVRLAAPNPLHSERGTPAARPFWVLPFLPFKTPIPSPRASAAAPTLNTKVVCRSPRGMTGAGHWLGGDPKGLDACSRAEVCALRISMEETGL